MTDKDDNKDDKLAARAKAAFDESVKSLDAERLSKLNQARQRALERLEPRRHGFGAMPVLPAGAAAVALLAMLMVFRGGDVNVELPGEPAAAETDFELLIDNDSLEMLEELEFYSWIELGDVDADGQQS